MKQKVQIALQRNLVRWSIYWSLKFYARPQSSHGRNRTRTIPGRHVASGRSLRISILSGPLKFGYIKLWKLKCTSCITHFDLLIALEIFNWIDTLVQNEVNFLAQCFVYINIIATTTVLWKVWLVIIDKLIDQLKIPKPSLVVIKVLHRKLMSSRLSFGLSNNPRIAKYF